MQLEIEKRTFEPKQKSDVNFYVGVSPLYVLSVMSECFRSTFAPVWSVVLIYLRSASGFCGVGVFMLVDLSLLYACVFCTCLFCDVCVPPFHIRVSVVLVWLCSLVYLRLLICLFSAFGLSGVCVSRPALAFLTRVPMCLCSRFGFWCQFYGGVISVFVVSSPAPELGYSVLWFPANINLVIVVSIKGLLARGRKARHCRQLAINSLLQNGLRVWPPIPPRQTRPQ